MMIRLLARIAPLLCLCAIAHAQSTIQVIDYGAEPRAPIRYKFTAGQSENAIMEMSMSGSTEVDGKVTPIASPATRTMVNMRVTEVAADGSAHVEFAMRSSEALAQPGASVDQASINKTLSGISLLSGSYRTDTRGHVLSQNVSVPDMGLPPELAQLPNQLIGDDSESMQEFPDEPVGPGAHWQAVAHRDVGPIKMAITQDFTLRSRSGNRIVLDMKVRIDMAAPNMPGMPALSPSTSTGTKTIDLDKLVSSSTMRSDSSQDITMPSAQGPAHTMKMQTKMQMQMFPEP